jgi:DUF1680 family protein
MHVSVVRTPANDTCNRHYLCNRPPLARNHLVRLPLGRVEARGWLGHQLELMAKGMTGNLSRLSSFLAPDNGWFGGDKDGWEEQPYWYRGFHDLADLTGEPTLVAEARRWIEAVFTSQDESGYFGAKAQKLVHGKNGQQLVDLWPHMVMLDAVIHHWDPMGSADNRVIPFMQRFFAFCRDIPEERFIQPLNEGFGDWRPTIQRDRAGDMIPHLHWLYNQTGEAWLLDLATRFYRHIRPANNEWLDAHVVHFTQRFSYSGLYYPQAKDPALLARSEYWYQQHLGMWGQQPRGIFGADENIRNGCVDPRQAIETCGMVEFNKSFYQLGRISGDPIWADRCEDVTLNHFPAASTPDLKALHYLTATNQPQLDCSEQHEYGNKGRQIDYSPHLYRCCQHNVAMGWPWYVQHLWQASPDNGLVAWLYGPCQVAAKVGEAGDEVRVYEETEYPFKGTVKLTVDGRKPVCFPLYLRVPGWCRGFQVAVNGAEVAVDSGPRTYVRIERYWSPGDTVALVMPMRLDLTTWPRNGSVTVDRGPLSYSVAVGERWQRCGGTEEWPEWEVLPTTPWNYGLELDRTNPIAGFSVQEKPDVPVQPWTAESAPVEIHARAKRIPAWGLENQTVQELRPSPIRSDEPTEVVRLIPLGCARLRVGCLPVIGADGDARDWDEHPGF